LKFRRAQVRDEHPAEPLRPTASQLWFRAAAQTIALLATALFVYLSVNSVTHPYTLGEQATHLAQWPSEGSLRVLALMACIATVSWLRHDACRVAPASLRRPMIE
jgi:hypothetical protein